MLQAQLENVKDVQISIETIRQQLRQANLRPRIQVSQLALTVDHNFARQHCNLVKAVWESALWSLQFPCIH